MYAHSHTLMRRHPRGWHRGLANLSRPPRSIGLHTSNARDVHLGDHVFLEPVMRACRRRGGRCRGPGAAMLVYFRHAGYTVVSPDDLLRQELRITSVFMIRLDARGGASQPDPISQHDRSPHPASHHGASRRVRPFGRSTRSRAAADRRPAAPRRAGPYRPRRGGYGGVGMVPCHAMGSRGAMEVAAEHRHNGFRVARAGTLAARRARSDGVDNLDLRGRTSMGIASACCDRRR